jgi:hypothetical protein
MIYIRCLRRLASLTHFSESLHGYRYGNQAYTRAAPSAPSVLASGYMERDIPTVRLDFSCQYFRVGLIGPLEANQYQCRHS